MSKSTQVLLAVVALAAGLAYWFWPDSSSGQESEPPAQGNPESSSEASDSAGVPTASHSEAAGTGAAMGMTPKPVRMRSSRSPGAKTGLATAFAGEERDEEWARSREQEIEARARTVLASAREDRPSAGRVQAGAVECRQRMCMLSLSSEDPAAMARAIEWMGDEQGFYRYADDMMVEATAREADGPRAVNVYLRFSR